jgi:hypothetical protein
MFLLEIEIEWFQSAHAMVWPQNTNMVNDDGAWG